MVSQSTKEKISEALKAKWASGTRKKNPPETYIKASTTQKKMYADGTRVAPGLTSEQARERGAKRDKDKCLQALRQNSINRLGTPMPPGVSAASPEHWKAKYWIFKSPDQQIIEGLNLNDLVRKHSNLFDPLDVEWCGKSKCKCRATKGLRGLFEMKKDGTGPRSLSWKGWMIGDRLDNPTSLVTPTNKT